MDEIAAADLCYCCWCQNSSRYYSAIQNALIELGDHHSFFVEPQPANQPGAGPITSDQEPHGQRLVHGIGYLELPHFEASEQAAKHYVLLAQDAIGTVDQVGICGWIVDLRNNDGGICGPCSLGLGRSWVKVWRARLLIPMGSNKPGAINAHKEKALDSRQATSPWYLLSCLPLIRTIPSLIRKESINPGTTIASLQPLSRTNVMPDDIK